MVIKPKRKTFDSTMRKILLIVSLFWTFSVQSQQYSNFPAVTAIDTTNDWILYLKHTGIGTLPNNYYNAIIHPNTLMRLSGHGGGSFNSYQSYGKIMIGSATGDSAIGSSNFVYQPYGGAYNNYLLQFPADTSGMQIVMEPDYYQLSLRNIPGNIQKFYHPSGRWEQDLGTGYGHEYFAIIDSNSPFKVNYDYDSLNFRFGNAKVRMPGQVGNYGQILGYQSNSNLNPMQQLFLYGSEPNNESWVIGDTNEGNYIQGINSSKTQTIEGSETMITFV